VRIEQVSSVSRQGRSALAVAKVHRLDETLIVEVSDGVTWNIEVTFGHDSEGTDRGERPTVFAVQLIDAVAITDEFALVAPGQIEVTHQGLPWIVAILFTRVVEARPFVAGIPRVILARTTPSSIGHRPLPCCLRTAVSGGP